MSRASRPHPRRSAPQKRALTQKTSLVIAVELGSEWPSWMSETVGNSPRRVIAQADGEDCLAFAARVRASAASGDESMALLCNQRADTRQMLSRRRLCENRRSRIWLSLPSNARDEVLEELVRMASELPNAELRAGAASPASRPTGAPLSSVA